MSYRSAVVAFALAAASGVAALPAAAETAAAGIRIENPYVRLAPPGARVTGAFMRIHNDSDENRKVVAAASDVSRVTELHTHVNDNGVMRMRRVNDIEAPAHGVAELRPGGLHVMLIDMKRQLQENERVNIRLTLDNGAELSVSAPVMRIMSGMKMHHGGGKGMQHGKMMQH